MNGHRNEGWQSAASLADMWPANGRRGAAPCARRSRREPLVSDRIRLALLVLVLVAFISARGRREQLGADRTHPARVRAPGSRRRLRPPSARRAVTATAAPRPAAASTAPGFTRFVFAHFGVALPHYSVAQFSLGRRVSRAALRAGRPASSSTGSATSASTSAADASSTRRTPGRASPSSRSAAGTRRRFVGARRVI